MPATPTPENALMFVMIAATLLSSSSQIDLEAKRSSRFCTSDFLTCGFGTIFTRIGGL